MRAKNSSGTPGKTISGTLPKGKSGIGSPIPSVADSKVASISSQLANSRNQVQMASMPKSAAELWIQGGNNRDDNRYGLFHLIREISVWLS